MIRLFLSFELGKIKKYFTTKTVAKSITTALFFGVFLFIAFGIYAFFVSGFRYINIEAMEDIRLALTLFLYELFLLVLSGIIMFSTMVSGIFNLFRGTYNNWILGSPKYHLLPKVVLIKSLLSSLLPTLIMFVPMILAFNKVYGLGFVSLILIMLSCVLFLTMISAFTLLMVLGIAFLYYKLSQAITPLRFSFKGLVLLLLGIIATTIIYVWTIVRSVDLVKLFKADTVSDTLSVSTISSHFDYLLTHPFAMEILNLQTGDVVSATYNFGIMVSVALTLVVLWWYTSFVFYPLWQKLQEGDLEGSKSISSQKKEAYHFDGSSTIALFKKEALISSRNYKGVLWFFFLFFIWLMQLGANKILGHNVQLYQPDISKKVAMLQAIQFIIAIYFMCSFTLRFVFPSFSVEKRTLWILLSAPLSFKKIFFGKYFFYSSFFVVLGILMSYINTLILKIPFTYALYSMVLFISVTVFIVTLGLMLGALYPSFETDDPEVISTSIPGLFLTAFSLMYGALSSWVLYTTLTKQYVSLLGLFVVITCVAIVFMLIKTPQLVAKKM